jgi:hypothetical protein
MAQADQVVQNDTFPTVRADINNNLAALFTNSSGGTAPTVTVAYQDWIDTSGADPIWKKRNAANNAWITVATIKSSTVELAADNVLPSQSGQSGNYLTTNGTVASWTAINLVPTTTQVLDATAGASVGEVGTYAWLGTAASVNASTTYADPGDTKPGSELRYAGIFTRAISTTVAAANWRDSTGPSGTWRCMASARNNHTSASAVYALWLRIS